MCCRLSEVANTFFICASIDFHMFHNARAYLKLEPEKETACRRFVINPLFLGKNGIMYISTRLFSEVTCAPFVLSVTLLDRKEKAKP